MRHFDCDLLVDVHVAFKLAMLREDNMQVSTNGIDAPLIYVLIIVGQSHNIKESKTLDEDLIDLREDLSCGLAVRV